MSRPVNVSQNDVQNPDWLSRWLIGFRTWVDSLIADRPRMKLVTIRNLTGASGSMPFDSANIPFVVGGACVVGVRNVGGVTSLSTTPFVTATRESDGRLSLAWFFMPGSGSFDVTVALFEA